MSIENRRDTLMKEKRIEKAIKKAQKKGIYNPKLKLGIVGLILVIGTIIGVSYAYYTKTATNTLTISGSVSKRINVRVESEGHGKIDGLDLATTQADFGISTRIFKVEADEGYQYIGVICKEDNGGKDVTFVDNVVYNSTNYTLTVTPRTSKDVTCTVEFEEIPYLRTKILKANTSKGSLSSDNFKTGCPTSNNDSCSGLYSMEDYNSSASLNYNNPGGTSYYFRGDVKDNYVKFANRNWRIVRVNGDGTIRLVLDGNIGQSAFNNTANARKYVGYTYGNSAPCTNASPCISNYSGENFTKSNGMGSESTINQFLETWYKNNLSSFDSKIALGIYCNDTSYGSGSETGELYYGPYQRLLISSSSVKPQLTCPDPTAEAGASSDAYDGYHTYGGVYKLKIGLPSADEIVLAGFKPSGNGVTTSNYLYYSNASNNYFWSSSPKYSVNNGSDAFYGRLNYRNLDAYYLAESDGVRPVINLNTNVTVTGSGTKGDPYVIK